MDIFLTAGAVLLALLAAVFYAINTPFSKVLLHDVAPTFMAAFLYMGTASNASLLGNFEI